MALVWLGPRARRDARVVLLDRSARSAVAGGVGSGPARRAADLTTPWLALASRRRRDARAYHGLVRRRVADTLGEALLMAGMIGRRHVADRSTRRDGRRAGWMDQPGRPRNAGGCRGGTPADAGRALGDEHGGVFRAAIEAPWCYLEFGDVELVPRPGRLEPRLRAAALQDRGRRARALGCAASGSRAAACPAPEASRRSSRDTARELLREARGRNGAMFLALPANGRRATRSTNSGSLLRALCRAAKRPAAAGPAAAEARVPHRTAGPGRGSAACC